MDVGLLGGKLLEVAVVVSKLAFLNSSFYLVFTLSHLFSLTAIFSSSDNSAIILTPSLASQCGFSVKTDQLGNTMIYASLQNCFAQNVVRRLEILLWCPMCILFSVGMVIILSLNSVCLQDDKAFTTTLNLRLHGNSMVEDELYQVAETCRYTTWASREIVCDRNYMEASERSRTLGGGVMLQSI